MDVTWYHGSPYELTELLVGSTITQDRHLAEVFSHKPAIVSVDDNGAIRHNGTLPGYLYRIAEPVSAEDVAPHPRSSMAPGAEWLTQRSLRVERIAQTTPVPAEYLSEADIAALQEEAAPEGVVRREEQARAGAIVEDWGVLTWLASAQIGNAGGVTVGRVTIAAGASNPRHSHTTCEEVLYLLSGRVEHWIGERSVILEAGDTLTVPANVVHGATVIGEEEADMIVAYSSGERDFVPAS
jgi:quercetin dioxygenase-like cupin family protein